MYSLTFYSKINVLIVLTSRFFWMGSKIISIREELEGWHTYWNLPNHVYHSSSKISQQIRIQNIYLSIFTLHSHHFQTQMNQRKNYFSQSNKGLQQFLEQILDFSVQNSQRHCRFPKKNRRNAKIYTQSIEISPYRMFNLKGLHPYPDAFHTQRHQDFAWVKLSVHPHQTISPLSCTLKTVTSADAYRM